MKWIRKGEHRSDCFGLKNVKDKTWDYAWGGLSLEYLSRGGKHIKRRGILWVVICCNDPSCDAVIMTPLDDFLGTLPKK